MVQWQPGIVRAVGLSLGMLQGFPWGLLGNGEQTWGEGRSPGCGPRNGCGGLQSSGLGEQMGHLSISV